jgi:hypothetical protein
MRRLIIAILMLAITLLVLAGPAAAEDKARIADLEPSYDKYDLKISFKVKGCFTRDIEKAIKSGIPTTFTFIVRVQRYSPTLFGEIYNDPIISHQWTHTICYDNLQDQFRVLWREQADRPFFFNDLEQAKDRQATVVDFPVAPLDIFSKDSKIIIDVRAKMEGIKLPYDLQKLLVFVSLWDFETPWKRIEITVP